MSFLGQQHKLAFHFIPLLCQLKFWLEQTVVVNFGNDYPLLIK